MIRWISFSFLENIAQNTGSLENRQGTIEGSCNGSTHSGIGGGSVVRKELNETRADDLVKWPVKNISAKGYFPCPFHYRNIQHPVKNAAFPVNDVVNHNAKQHGKSGIAHHAQVRKGILLV